MSEIDKPLFIIADGAAFGAYIARVMAVAKQQCNIALYLPESFEWLILRSGVVDVEDIDRVCEKLCKNILTVSAPNVEVLITSQL